jgi:hypothetical protein
MAWTEPPRLLTDTEAKEIEDGVQSGMRGPILDRWVRQLLADRALRVRLEREGRPLVSPESIWLRYRPGAIRPA